MQKIRIEISSKFKKDLMNEFRISLTSVQKMLDFENNSDLAKKVRKRAKEMMVGEILKIEEDISPSLMLELRNHVISEGKIEFTKEIYGSSNKAIATAVLSS